MGPPGKFERQAHSRPKHGKPSDSGASRATPPPNSRPLERGEGCKKKAPPRKSQPPQNPAPNLQDNILPVHLQQLILDIFRVTFPASQEFADLKPLLSQINEALLQGSYETAFRTEESREGYAIRWSPSHALVHANVLEQVCDEATHRSRCFVLAEERQTSWLWRDCFGTDEQTQLGNRVLRRRHCLRLPVLF
jgi:25S rRNA (uracil2843-N3)-methyltransferase